MIKHIKNILLTFFLAIFKYHLKLFYFFIKIFTKRKRQVFLLSRQYNHISINYKLIIEELKSENIPYVVICKKVPKSINSILRNEKKATKILKQFSEIINYYFNIYKQMLYCATSKIIIVDGYNLTVSILKHKKDTKIIQIWHALGAIKKFGYQTIGNKDGLNVRIAKILCMHNNYDYIISGSKEMNKFFSEAFHTDINKVIECGTPTIDYLLKSNKNIIKNIYDRYPQLKTKENILYSPTFRTDGSNNYKDVIKNFNFEKYNLILTFHPKMINDNDFNSNKVITVDSKLFSTYDILRVCDYVVTDYSALAIDACVLNKKILFYVYDYDKYNNENGINIDLYKELKGNTSKNFKEIMEIIENRYNIASLKKFKNKYISNLEGNSTKKIVDLIKVNL